MLFFSPPARAPSTRSRCSPSPPPAARKSLGALVGGGLGTPSWGAAATQGAYAVRGEERARGPPLPWAPLAAATPAAHAASALATAAEPAARPRRTVAMAWAWRTPRRRSRATRATGGDAFALREPEVVSVFRFDLMGQAHATTPLPDATYGYKAGKLEEGTFCAVPVVGASWTIADPVPMWYVCENDWRLFVDCEEAYIKDVRRRRDWYGKDRLRDCPRRPEAPPAVRRRLPLRRAAAVAAAAAARAAGTAAVQCHVARERHVRERNRRRERDGGVRGGVRGRRGAPSEGARRRLTQDADATETETETGSPPSFLAVPPPPPSPPAPPCRRGARPAPPPPPAPPAPKSVGADRGL